MLHLQLRVPDDLTEQVVGLMTADETVTNVAVFPAGHTKPAGAMVIADVAREGANPVVAAMRALDLHRRGSIMLSEPRTLLSDASPGPLTEFIIEPDIWSFLIALLAAAAGVLALTTSKSGPLVGVFISVTTVPAVGTLALCLGVGVWSEIPGALVPLGINLAGLVLAGTVTLLVQRVVWSQVSR